MLASPTPAKITTPITILLSAPGPDANTRGIALVTVVKVVITMGLSRCCAALSNACSNKTPLSRSWLANSTIKMPFFAAKPINITMPIWLYMFKLIPINSNPVSAPTKAKGTVNNITKGCIKLSNCADSTKKVINNAKTKINKIELPDSFNSKD